MMNNIFSLDYGSINTLTVFLSVFLLAVLFYHSFLCNYLNTAKRKKDPSPPGPRGWPVVGCLPNLVRKDARKVLAKYVEEFGEVYKIQMGSQDVILLNSVDAIKEAFVQMGQKFSDRPHIFVSDYITKGAGIVLSSGKLWKEHRHFSHTVLKDFGMGRLMLEDKVHDGISHMLIELDKLNSKEFDVHHLLMMTVANVIHQIVTGKSYDYEDKFFKHLIGLYEHTTQVTSSSGIENFFPYLIHLPGDLFQLKSICNAWHYVLDIYRQICLEHMESLDQNHDRDYVDVYLKKLNSLKDTQIETTLSVDQLVQVITDLFMAGGHTTNTTLRWGFVYLLHNPDVQEKLQKEIDDVIGSARNPSMADRNNMPYSEAYISELQRMADIVPFGVPHATAKDVTFRGYHIAKGTQIWPNLYYIHHNKISWGNPEAFKPERFLDDDGQFQKPDNILPFSIGRRICLGESLARMQLFLFTTSILQKFTVLPPVDGTLPSLEGILGFTYVPHHFKLRFRKR